MKSSDKIAIVDLDGTLVFEDNAIKNASKIVFGKEISRNELRKMSREVKSKIYSIAQKNWQNYIKKEKVVNKVNELKNKGFIVIILTARKEDVKEETKKLLRSIGVNYDKLIMRSEEEMKLDDEVWKQQILDNLINNNTKEIVFFEDKPENIEFFIKKVNQLKEKFTDLKDKYFLVVGIDLFKKI
ncbi:MAG: DUF2608 domain-containing protein [Nanoarchaeota archaeon]